MKKEHSEEKKVAVAIGHTAHEQKQVHLSEMCTKCPHDHVAGTQCYVTDCRCNQ